MKATGEASAIGWHHRLALRLRPRSILVAAQVALSLILLAGAALLIESLAGLSRVQPGFEPRNLLSMQITLPQARHQELVRRVESIPGVEAAAMTLTLPMTGYAGTPVQAAGQPLLKLNERPIAILQTVTPGYFRTLGIPMRHGRDFTLGDTSTTPLVAIVNESLARRFWPGQDPVGQHILIGSNPTPVLVTAVVADVRQAGLAQDADPGVYRPRTQTPEMPAMFAVRTAADPLHLVKAIRYELAAIDANQAIAEVKTMLAVVDASENQRRSIMILLTLFAATGLLLVIVGIYGVMAYSVGQRTRELGIRRALGAPEGHILRLVLAQGLSLAIAGVTLGLAGAVALTRAMQGLLYRISPTDPLTLGGVAVGLIVVTIAASYLPARRAIRISPTAAMNGL